MRELIVKLKQSGASAGAQKSTQSAGSSYAEIATNGMALAPIAVASTLLSRQIASQEKAFVEEGGFTERLYRVRTWKRARG